jgi:hypothetical protein
MNISSHTSFKLIEDLVQDYNANKKSLKRTADLVAKFKKVLSAEMKDCGISRPIESSDLKKTCIRGILDQFGPLITCDSEQQWVEHYTAITVEHLNILISYTHREKYLTVQLEFTADYQKMLKSAISIEDKRNIIQKMAGPIKQWEEIAEQAKLPPPSLSLEKVSQYKAALELPNDPSTLFQQLTNSVINELKSNISETQQLKSLFNSSAKKLKEQSRFKISLFEEENRSIEDKLSKTAVKYQHLEKNLQSTEIGELYSKCQEINKLYSSLLPSIDTFYRNFDMNLERIRHEKLISNLAWRKLEAAYSDNSHNHTKNSKFEELIPSTFKSLGKLLDQRAAFIAIMQKANDVYHLFIAQPNISEPNNPSPIFALKWKIETKFAELQPSATIKITT